MRIETGLSVLSFSLLVLALAGCNSSGGGGSSANTVGPSTVVIEDDDVGNALSPKVVVDAAGNAFAIWEQLDGIQKNILVNRYDAASDSWGSAEPLDMGTGNGVVFDIIVDANGNATAVWDKEIIFSTNPTRVRTDIWVNRYDATSGWGNAVLIETEDSSNAITPRLGIDVAGNVIAVWQHGGDIRYNRFVAGSWGTAGIVSNNPVSESRPQIAVHANSGDAMVVWQEFSNSTQNIVASRFDAGLAIWSSPPELLETDNTGDALFPMISVDSLGNFIAVWRQEDAVSPDNIWANRYDDEDGIWSGPELLESIDTGRAINPQIAMSDSGDALAVWVQSDAGIGSIWSNRYDSVTGWGSEELIETNDAGSAKNPVIAMNGVSGNAVAVWYQYDGSAHNIWANLYDAAGGLWGLAETIEEDAGDAEHPDVAVNASGTATVVWDQFDGLRDSIFARQYD